MNLDILNLQFKYINRVSKYLFFLVSGIMLITLIEFNNLGGLTLDEPQQLQRVYNQIHSGLSVYLDRDSSYFDPYGLIQKLPAFITSQIFSLLTTGSFNDEVLPNKLYYNLSHIFTCIFSIGTCWTLYASSKEVGFKNKWVAPTLLICSPVYLGHSIFNIKDIPFAFFYSLFSWYLLKIYKNKNWDTISPFFIAMVSSMKLTTLPVMIGSFLIASFCRDFIDKKIYEKFYFYKFLFQRIILVFFTFILVFTFLPSSWSEPIRYFKSSFLTFISYEWTGCVTFAGTCSGKYNIGGLNTFPDINSDWSVFKYIINWFSIKLSFLNLISIIFSIVLFSRSVFHLFKKNSISFREYARIIFGLQVLSLPILIIIANSNLYDGIRHLLFLLPAASYLLADGLNSIFLELKIQIFKIAIVLIIFVSLIFNIFDIVALSPYQYIYMNEFGIISQRYEDTDLDYWGASLGELYKKSKLKYDIFPKGGKFLPNFRAFNNIKLSNQTEKNNIKLNTRPPDVLEFDRSRCSKTITVNRRYPITNKKIEISSLINCFSSNK